MWKQLEMIIGRNKSRRNQVRKSNIKRNKLTEKAGQTGEDRDKAVYQKIDICVH